MAIILEDMTKEQFEELRNKVASIDNMEERLEAMSPLTNYRYEEQLLNEAEWKTRLETVEAERDDFKRRYIERFFSGTGLEDDEIDRTRQIDEEEEKDGAYSLNPATYEELYKEE